jgi:membrane-associated protease RseP (regulator of RpoE activity)
MKFNRSTVQPYLESSMRRHLQAATLTLSLVSATAVAAVAQEAPRERVRVSEPRSFLYQIGPDDLRVERRGRLGITVDLRPDAAGDSLGARVSGVTPGGPADRAGVRTGDIITRLNGTRLVGEATPRSNDDDGPDDRSGPGMRLINLASRLEPGDTVRLDLRRENRNLTLTFQADRTDMDQLVERMRVPGNGMTMMREFGPGMGGAMAGPMSGTMHVMVNGGGMGDLELVTVTPQLAEGLGISEGVLVVSVDSASTLGLRAGDVITSIAGRRPTSPAHAMRILGSYDPGETVSFDVMRQRRHQAVNGRIPEARSRAWRITPNNFEFTVPTVPGEPMRRFFDNDEAPMMMDLPRLRELMRDRPGLERHLGPDQMPKMLLRNDGKV